MKTKIYLGVISAKESVIFRSARTPTEKEFGDKFLYSIGPFRTKRGALFMKEYGKNNPHCQTVDQAEKLAKKCI